MQSLLSCFLLSIFGRLAISKMFSTIIFKTFLQKYWLSVFSSSIGVLFMPIKDYDAAKVCRGRSFNESFCVPYIVFFVKCIPVAIIIQWAKRHLQDV